MLSLGKLKGLAFVFWNLEVQTIVFIREILVVTNYLFRAFWKSEKTFILFFFSLLFWDFGILNVFGFNVVMNMGGFVGQK